MGVALDSAHLNSAVRDHKGHSLLTFPSRYVVLDLETTGLDPQYDDIIEVAAIRIVDGASEGSFSSLVNPGYPIDEFITDLTGITDDMLSSAPSLDSVLPALLSFIGADVVVGHNVNFDINFIYDSCSARSLAPFSNDFVDTMRISRKLFPDERHHRLSDLICRFGIGESVSHRAFSDVEQTDKCYRYLRSYVSDHGFPLNQQPKSWRAGDIVSFADHFDESSPIFGKVFVFTGTLDKMTRKAAMQLVVDRGGVCLDGVRKDVNYLVLGANDYSKIKDGKSNKQKAAEKLRLKGNDIEIISENVFYEMLEA